MLKFDPLCFIADHAGMALADAISEAYRQGQQDTELEIIRCKDCKHWHREIYNGIEYFNFSSCNLNRCGDGLNFYCAGAERKEGEK